MCRRVCRVPMPGFNIGDQIQALIQELLMRIVEEDVQSSHLESERKFEEAKVSETRGIRTELMVAQLEARLHNRPIDLVDRVQESVNLYMTQLRAQYDFEVRNQQWHLADKTGILLDKINDASERRFDIRVMLMAEMRL